jgi:hypothetical protein
MDCPTEALLRHAAKHPLSKAADDHLQCGGARLGFYEPIWAKDYFRPPPVIVFD